MINATREKLKSMEVVLNWTERRSTIREGFIEEIAFTLDLDGLVSFEHMVKGRKGLQGREYPK